MGGGGSSWDSLQGALKPFSLLRDALRRGPGEELPGELLPPSLTLGTHVPTVVPTVNLTVPRTECPHLCPLRHHEDPEHEFHSWLKPEFWVLGVVTKGVERVEASVRLGHKTLRTWMKRSSLW